MKILIVDDDDRRSASLAAYIVEACSIHSDHISQASCIAEARQLLRATYFDVLVLDVVLPKRKDKLDPSPQNGMDLLKALNRDSSLKKPERVIGITAYLSDVDRFRSEFEESCNIVVEAISNSDVWKRKIALSLAYTVTSKTSRAVYSSRTAVLSVHGIRTFGQWQARLRRLIEERTEGVAFHTYKFGYFSSVVFLFPFLRAFQVKRLAGSMRPVLSDENLDRIFIFCHSFGTYLVANALKLILKGESPKAKITLVLSGSMLSSTFDWKSVSNDNNFRIVNECGSRDFVLWLSAACVLGAGMAGKLGFYGFNNRFLMNRFFIGGHSLYFASDSFMLQQWVPLLDEESELSEIDERVNSGFFLRVLENLVVVLGFLKPWIYAALPISFVYFIWF
jgi:CheY-like chemotaxis protein